MVLVCLVVDSSASAICALSETAAGEQLARFVDGEQRIEAVTHRRADRRSAIRCVSDDPSRVPTRFV